MITLMESKQLQQCTDKIKYFFNFLMLQIATILNLNKILYKISKGFRF